MPSRSSSSAPHERLPVGRVAGHRGGAGELTVRVADGEAAVWQGIELVWLGEGKTVRAYAVEHARSYRDRLVLKLAGVDDPSTAADLRGRTVFVDREAAPVLPEGRYHAGLLVGCTVYDESTRELGVVEDIVHTGGVDLLRVLVDGRPETELLVPMAAEILRDVAPEAARIVVRLPSGLEEL